MSERVTWRDRVVSGAALVLMAGVGWLMVGLASESGEAKGHDLGQECIPVCHYCAGISGVQDGPGLKILARKCVADCEKCRETRQAAQRLDVILLHQGGMEPG